MTSHHPKFIEAMNALSRYSKEERIQKTSPDIVRWTNQAMRYAPREIQDQITTKMQELGLLPDVTHCDAQGNPVFSLDQVATKLGIAEDELRYFIDSLPEDDQAHCLVDPASIIRVQ